MATVYLADDLKHGRKGQALLSRSFFRLAVTDVPVV